MKTIKKTSSTSKTTTPKRAAKKKAPAKKKAAARKKPVARPKAVVKRKKAASGKKAVAKKKAPAGRKAPASKRGRSKGTKAAVTKTAVTPKTRALTAAQRRKTREILIEMRSRLTVQVASLRDDSLRRDDSGNIEEEGTDAFERQFALNLASSEQSSIVAIDDALRRLDEGQYGMCEDCGGSIERPRLDALPFVRTCIGCQSEKEKTLHRRRAF